MSDSAIPWTGACLVPLSMGFSRQEYWSGICVVFTPVNIHVCQNVCVWSTLKHCQSKIFIEVIFHKMYLGKLGDLVILGIDFSMENLTVGMSSYCLLTHLHFPGFQVSCPTFPLIYVNCLAPMASKSLAAERICRILFEF